MTKKQALTSTLEELTTVSELIDRLSIENIRLWNLQEDIKKLQKELKSNSIKKRKDEIKQLLLMKENAKKDIIKKCAMVKKTIDEVIMNVIRKVAEGHRVNITNEHKAYGK